MLVEKEVIRPGQYWYRDESSGLPRKLTVTPELTKYWCDQGNAMLSDGLVVPVPYEHDFTAHPMTPKDKLLNNAGEVKQYYLKGDKGDRLFGTVDVQDPNVKSKIGTSIRWTSPWINSFTDGNGKSWSNVISHLALTTRPRITKQEPFGSIAAALSMASDTTINSITDKGICLSRAGRIDDGKPAYPIAFSLWGGVSLNTEHDKATGQFTGPGKGGSKKTKAPAPNTKEDYSDAHHAKLVHALTGHDIQESKKKFYNHYALGHYMRAASHVHNDVHKGGRSVRDAITANFTGRLMDKALKSVGHEKGTDEEHRGAGRGPVKDWDDEEQEHKAMALAIDFKKKNPPDAPKGDDKPAPGSAEEDADELGVDDEDEDGDDIPDELQDTSGDIRMEEILCHLLQALGVPMPDDSDETQFQRHLYEAAMSKIKELTSKGLKNEEDKNDPTKNPDQNKPPNQNPNASHPSKAPNPLIQQEQQPMYMSLDEINKLPDPMKGVALAMYNENAKLRAELDAGTKVTNSLRDSKLKEENAKRTSRAALLSRLSPKVKADLDAMLSLPAMALSMGEGGAVVDPMAQTLAILEKGLADMPRLLTTEHTALSVQPHPQDADAMTPERVDEIADTMARQMGCPPEKKAG